MYDYILMSIKVYVVTKTLLSCLNETLSVVIRLILLVNYVLYTVVAITLIQYA